MRWRTREGMTSPAPPSSSSSSSLSWGWTDCLSNGDKEAFGCNGERGHGELDEAVVPESEAVSSSQLEDSSSSSSVVYGELEASAEGRASR